MAGPLNYAPSSKGLNISGPSDALQLGTHSAPGNSSKHKRMVSGVLHLKRESVGTKTKRTAYATIAKAFGKHKNG